MEEKKNRIRIYYENNMAKAGYDYEMLGWESQEAQNMRFDILLTELNMQGRSILDVGCGLGNLLEYLTAKSLDVEYYGVDILEPMIERARKKNLNGEFCCIDIFKESPFREKQFDVVYASGIFNLNLGNNPEFLKKALEVFFKLSKDCVVFNLLHHLSPGKEDRYFYFVPQEVKKMLESEFNPTYLKIIERYLNNDFTVVCRK